MMATVFWDRKGRANDGIHATRDQNNVTRVLQNTKKLHSEQNPWNADIQHTCSTPCQCGPHTHTAARTQPLLEHFNRQLLDHLPHSPVLTPNNYHLSTYLDHGASTMMRSWWKVSKCSSVQRQQTSLTQAYKGLLSNTTSASILAVTTLRKSLSIHTFLYTIFTYRLFC
jgi:hypothetical protein